MGRTIGTALTLQDKFSPVLGTIGNNIGGFNKKLGQSTSKINKFGNDVGNTFSKIAKNTGQKVGSIGSKVAGLAAGFGIAKFAKDSIELASNLNEVQNVVDTAFGSNADTINKFSKDAINNFGLSELQAKQFAGTIGSLGAGMGISGQNLADFSTKLTGLSGDFASFYNLNPEEAFDKIKAGIVGSSEPLLSLGIDMRDAALETYVATNKMKKSWKEMNGTEKTQVRFNYLMEKGKLATGDFVKTQDGFANQTRILKNNIQSAGASIASIFLPSLNGALKTFNSFMSSKNIEWVTNKVKDLSTCFGNWLSPKLKEFKSFAESSLIPKFRDIGNSIQSIVKEHGPAIESAFDSITTFAGKLANQGLERVKKGLNWFSENKDVVDGALGFIKGSFKMLSDFIDGDFKGAFENATGAIINLIDSFSDLTLQMRNSDNPLLKHLIGRALDIPVSIIEGASKGDINRIIGDPEEVLKKKREDRAKSRDINKNYNQMLDDYKNKYKDVKTDPRGTALPQFASGTSFTPKGLLVKNEKGGEITVSRGGEAIIPADRTERLLKNQNMNDTVVVNKSSESSKANINLYITIQGNVIGNEELYDDVGQHISNRLSLALGNV